MAENVNRRFLALVALVLLSVTAISMAAATVDDATGAGANASYGGGYFGPSSNVTDSNADDGGPGLDGERSGGPNTSTLDFSGCNDLLESTPGTLAYFGALVGILYLIKRRFSLGLTMLGGYAITPIFLTVYFLRTQCASAGGPGLGDPNNGSDGPFGDPPISGNEIPPSLMLGLFAVLFLGVAAAIYVSSGSRRFDEEDEEAYEEEADVEDIAAAAGAAADRLEARNADVDNEVYQAWWEMTQLLNVSSPESYTPGQFADAAVELGIQEEHVDALTTLFEEVRYGHRDAETREQRAIDVFREIEAYGTDDATGSNAAEGSGMDDADGDGSTEGDR